MGGLGGAGGYFRELRQPQCGAHELRCHLPGAPTDAPRAPPTPAPPQAIDKRRSAPERELHGALRVLARHLPQDQYETLADGLAVGRRWGDGCALGVLCASHGGAWWSLQQGRAGGRALPQRPS